MQSLFTIKVLSLSELEKELPESFVRCHISYMINTKFVKCVKRFQVILDNDVHIHIPKKKYTKIRISVLQKSRKLDA